MQVLVLPYTANYQQTFSTAAPKYFDTPEAGTWSVNGSYTGTAPAGGVAISTVDGAPMTLSVPAVAIVRELGIPAE